MKPTIPRKKTDDPEIPFTASFATALLQRLERTEKAVLLVKGFLAVQLSAGDKARAVAVLRGWKELEDAACAASLDELQWTEKVLRSLSRRTSRDPDA